jgi:hypothetical protein
MNDPADLTLTLDPRTLDYVAACIQQHPAAAAAIAQAESQRVMQLISEQVQAQQKEKAPEGLLNGAGAESPALTQ